MNLLSMVNGLALSVMRVTPTPAPGGTSGGWESNPIQKLREKLAFRWSIFEGLDFIFFIMAVPYTLLSVGLLLYCLWGVLKFLWSTLKGQKPIADKPFWIRVAVVIFVCFLLFSGIFWDVLEAMYSWTSNQEVTG